MESAIRTLFNARAEQVRAQVFAKKRCSRCLYDEFTPGIAFDPSGECSYCRLNDELVREYPTGEKGADRLGQLADAARKAGKGHDFDVVVGVSGGCDSSYMLMLTKQLGLRPLAVHFDNTWNSREAVENIHNVLGALKVELHTHVVDNEVYNDIYRAFLLAGVPDIEAPTDIGLATTLYEACAKFGIKYIFEGHSFRTEGISPLGWLYMDGKYIQSVVKRHGAYRQHRMRSFPNLWLSKFLQYTVVNQIKKIRPLYYMDYRKEDVKRMLAKDFGWQWYGGHHLENRFSAFAHSYVWPTRFGIDTRALGYSALVRNNQMEREVGLELMAEPHVCDPAILEMVKKRLAFNDAEFDAVITQPKHTYHEYKTYKRTFERLRPLFWALYRADLVPKSFYLKFTSKSNQF